MRVSLYGFGVIAGIACSALQAMETGKVITPTSGVVTPENGWVIDVYSDHIFVPTGSTKIYSTMPVKKRGLIFTPKKIEEGQARPLSHNNSKPSKTEIHGESEEPEHPNELTHDIMRDSHNSLMAGLQANLSNMASIATMGTTQWKRTMTVMVVSGIFGVTQLALQAYLASHNCAK